MGGGGGGTFVLKCVKKFAFSATLEYRQAIFLYRKQETYVTEITSAILLLATIMMRNRHENLSASNLDKETWSYYLFNLQCDFSASTLRPHQDHITGQGWLKSF